MQQLAVSVAVKNFALSKLASHHFAMEKSVKDVSLEEMLQAMYWHGFSELVEISTMLKYGEVSCEDKTFMKIVKRGLLKKDDHYRSIAIL